MEKALKIGERRKPHFQLSDFYDALLTVLYPHFCKVCEKSVEARADGTVCRKCWRQTKIFSGAEILCNKCGAYLRDGKADFEVFCRQCAGDFYDVARAVGIYEKALLISVLGLKKEPYIPQTLKTLLRKAFLNAEFQYVSQIIPVPLSKKRIDERGFNQSAVLAHFLGKSFGLPVNEKMLSRKKHSLRHRPGMDRKARRESVENVFEIAAKTSIENQSVLLVDDVFTSGATVSACAEVLKANGAAKVYVLSIARAF